MQHACHARLLACLLLISAVATAETVVLRNGFRLHAQQYEPGSQTMRLLLSNGGWVQVPAGDVLRVEHDVETATDTWQAEPVPTNSGNSASLVDEIDRFADLAGLPRDLVRAVVWAESGGRQDVVSSKGALGLMQLMPETAAELGVDPRDASENLEGGTRYLRQMLDRYEGDRDQLVKALAAYNSGPGRVEEFGGLPPYSETVAYVAKIVRRFLDTGPDVAGIQ